MRWVAELLKLFELGLDFAPGTLKQFFKKDMNSLRLLHYPPQKPDEEGNISWGTRPYGHQRVHNLGARMQMAKA